jgi:hypothetical protein
MSRPGKIARLPHETREQLNQRLLDGQPAQSILTWLAAQPEVQLILDAHFEGQPVSEQNLSEWRYNGFRLWRTRQEALSIVRAFQDENGPADQELAGPISDKLVRWAAIQYAATAQALLASQDDPAAHWSRLREFCADVARLRRSDLAADRVGLDRERLALKKTNDLAKKEEEFWAWTKRPDIRKSSSHSICRASDQKHASASNGNSTSSRA